jgi:superfamily II DNA/RNA helicase
MQNCPLGERSLRPSSSAVPPAGSFRELALPPVLVNSLTERGLTVPFAIQSASRPDAPCSATPAARGIKAHG